MKLNGVMFLAANTTRSQTYAQAMVNNGIEPEVTLIFGVEKERPQIIKNRISGLWTPDLDESLVETVKNFDFVHSVAVGDVNDQIILDEIIKRKPRLLIYSGYGGQIVKKRVLDCGVPFLHIHSGWLPDFRGSTTVYYSILKERCCGASAIILSPEIDTGTIIKKKKYSVPQLDVNIDHIYDNSIRADLLVDVLKSWKVQGKFLDTVDQDSNTGDVYYVIHPLLKHLSILSLSL